MRRSKYYNMRLPERGAREGEANDAADIEDLTYDLEIIDKEMELQRLEDARLEKEKANQDDLIPIRKRLDDLEYVPVAIGGLSVSPSVAEQGATIQETVLQWKLNKTPKKLTLDGTALAPSAVSHIDTSLHTEGHEYKLTAIDERDAQATASVKLQFLNGAYWGDAAVPNEINSAFILTLQKVLTGTRARTITAAPGEGQYIWYAIPIRFGTPVFSVGGFEGGFSRAAVLEFTNGSGYTEPYGVWRSDNAALGSTTVVIK